MSQHTRYFFYVVVSALIIGVGCKQPRKSDATVNWSSLIIIVEENEVINISNDEDTSVIKINDIGSFFTGFHKVKVHTLKVYFTMAEKDTLFELSKDIISDNVRPKIHCTDFVGDLKLTIEYSGGFKKPGTYTQSIEYEGVCEWDTISENTRKLNKILERKIKWKNW